MEISEATSHAPPKPWRRPLALIGWTLLACHFFVNIIARGYLPHIFDASRNAATYLLAAAAVVCIILDKAIADRRNIYHAARHSGLFFAVMFGLIAIFFAFDVTTWTDPYTRRLRQEAALSQLCRDGTPQSAEKQAICARLVEVFPGGLCNISRPDAPCRKRLEPFLKPAAPD